MPLKLYLLLVYLKLSTGCIFAPKSIPSNLQEENTKSDGQKIVCYYSTPQKGWPLLPPSFVNPDLCTHIIVGFAHLKQNYFHLSKSQRKVCSQLKLLKNENPNLKLMLSIGGGSADGFSEVVANHTLRDRFVTDSVKTVVDIGFDGIDVDWEFPAFFQPFRERFDFVHLLEDLRTAVDEVGLLLSVAVSASKTIIDRCYRVKDISRLVDFVNLMAYDFHQYKWYLPVTGLNAPLFRRSEEHYLAATRNTQWAALYWLELGLPKEKLVVGVPLYGVTYTLAANFWNGVGTPSTGVGTLWTDGQIPYPIVCTFLSNNATRVWESEARVPFAYRDNQWVSYDDEQSLREKARWIREGGFAGIMIFDLNCDDYNFVCGNSTFPLNLPKEI